MTKNKKTGAKRKNFQSSPDTVIDSPVKRVAMADQNVSHFPIPPVQGVYQTNLSPQLDHFL